MSQPSSPKITRAFKEVNESLLVSQQNRIRDAILANMTSNSRVAESRRRYTTTVLGFAMIIAMISLTSYKALRNYLYLPSPSILSRYFRDEIKETKELITNFNHLGLALDLLNEQLSDAKDNVTKWGGVLAVDAMSLRPHVIITKNGFVDGIIGEEFIADNEFQEFKMAFQKYENYIRTIKNKTITDTFVYYYQPLNVHSRPFTVYAEPSTQGKATGVQIDRLATIEQLLTEKGFPVVGIAFDGDTTYTNLHREFFDAYYERVKMDVDFSNFSEILHQSVISDPLHLLKRARYRLLSSTVHATFENVSHSVVSLDLLQQQLNLPSVVFSDEKYTKMHDSLATQLFSLRSLATLFECKNFPALAYFLPMCLLTASLSEKELQVEERFSLLQVGLYYMIGYYSMLQDSTHVMRQKKHRNNTHVCAFDAALVREYCNTVVSILKELNRVNGSLSLNRIGSNPLEHLFGLVRMKSHSVHTFDKMLQVMSKSVLQSKLLRDIGENQKVDKRQSYFAHDVVNRPDAITTVLNGQPRDIAFILHCVLGLPIATNNLMLWDVFTMYDLRSEIFENFAVVVKTLAKRCSKERSSNQVTSTRVSVHSGTQIRSRLVDQKILP